MKSFIQDWILNRFIMLLIIDILVVFGICVIDNPYLNAVVIFILIFGNMSGLSYLMEEAELTRGEKVIESLIEHIGDI